jgi:hypothetical protein
VLNPTVKGVISQLFDELERDFGPKLVKYAIGFLTYSVAGVSDGEMQDLLSLSDEVLEEVFQYSKPESVRRLPLHVWLRLRGALTGLLVERSHHCWSWYHRQLTETADERCEGKGTSASVNVNVDGDKEATAARLLNVQKILGNYFSDLVTEDVRINRLIASQPLNLKTKTTIASLPSQSTNISTSTSTQIGTDKGAVEVATNSIWSPNALINERRCVEGATHLVAAKLTHEAIEELCSFALIGACVMVGLGYKVLRNMADLDIMLTNG